MEHVSTTPPSRPTEPAALPARGPARSPLGHSSPLPEPDRAVPTALIRAFRGDPALDISFIAVADDGLTETYADDRGYEYRIDREDGQLVAVDRQEDLHSKARPSRPEARLPVAELRNIAVALVSTLRPEFAALRSSLHPYEGNRDRELYLFRWEDFNRPLPESCAPPFVQVGLYADGRLASYADTLGKRKTES